MSASDTVILERVEPDAVDREPTHVIRARACDASLRPIRQGTADQHFPLALRFGDLGLLFSAMGEGHPVDAALAFGRRVARDPVLEIHPDHHAARSGLSLSFHAPTVEQGEASVTLQPNGTAQ